MKPQFKPEEIYLDLSKLSEEQQRKISVLINGILNLNSDRFLLSFNPYNQKWELHKYLYNGKELTYSQFLDMMGESEEVLQVENNGWIKIESEKDLPPYNKWVIAHTKDGANHIAYFDKRKSEWVANSKFGDEITHWRHEPEPPKF